MGFLKCQSSADTFSGTYYSLVDHEEHFHGSPVSELLACTRKSDAKPELRKIRVLLPSQPLSLSSQVMIGASAVKWDWPDPCSQRPQTQSLQAGDLSRCPNLVQGSSERQLGLDAPRRLGIAGVVPPRLLRFFRGAWHSRLHAKIYWIKVVEMNTAVLILGRQWWGTGRAPALTWKWPRSTKSSRAFVQVPWRSGRPSSSSIPVTSHWLLLRNASMANEWSSCYFGSLPALRSTCLQLSW